ncbi:hypothetical protein [Jannaschia formosa]|uniref:hypothetical protein n=1 Tax=Jannaschia formosa TaxID=2259592 RepID=UPI000E1BABF4|nr:hypothetical protein [Jannaschia formosa]TFL19383.1 hypothetical protein DR046_05530 [Jannaschia formosa]
MPSASSPAVERISVFAPWPIFTVTIERAPDGSDEVYFHAGGQGAWVARMTAALGCRTMLAGPVGGEAGRIVQALIHDEEDFDLRMVAIHGATGGHVDDRRSGRHEEIARVPVPTLDRHESDEL